VEGVKGCFRNAGQLQIIFGTGVVNKVYAAFIRRRGLANQASRSGRHCCAQTESVPARARLLSNIFVPIIPAIVASGC
jgi:PTS system sucrose-specific IIC component